MALALWYTNPLPAARTPEIRMIPVLCRPHTACEKRLHPVPPGEKSPVLLRPSADISGHHPEENPDKQQDSHNTQNRIRHKDRHKKQGNLNIQKHPPQLIHSVSPVHHTAQPVSKTIHLLFSPPDISDLQLLHIPCLHHILPAFSNVTTLSRLSCDCNFTTIKFSEIPRIRYCSRATKTAKILQYLCLSITGC